MSLASEKNKVFYLFNLIILDTSNDKDLCSFKYLLEMLTDQEWIQNKTWGCLVGHPYIASLWIGSLALKLSSLKEVLCRSSALFCLLPSYHQASENWLAKGSKGPFVIFTRPFSCLNGVNAIQGILSCISWIASK